MLNQFDPINTIIVPFQMEISHNHLLTHFGLTTNTSLLETLMFVHFRAWKLGPNVEPFLNCDIDLDLELYMYIKPSWLANDFRFYTPLSYIQRIIPFYRHIIFMSSDLLV